MASSGKRRKLNAVDRKAEQVGPRKTRDGDRRRRTKVDLAREAVAAKQRAQSWTIDDAPPLDGP